MRKKLWWQINTSYLNIGGLSSWVYIYISQNRLKNGEAEGFSELAEKGRFGTDMGLEKWGKNRTQNDKGLEYVSSG